MQGCKAGKYMCAWEHREEISTCQYNCCHNTCKFISRLFPLILNRANHIASRTYQKLHIRYAHRRTPDTDVGEVDLHVPR